MVCAWCLCGWFFFGVKELELFGFGLVPGFWIGFLVASEVAFGEFEEFVSSLCSGEEPSGSEVGNGVDEL